MVAQTPPQPLKRPNSRLWWPLSAVLAIAIGLWMIFFRTPDVSQALADAMRYLDLADYASAEMAYDQIVQRAPGHQPAKQGYYKARIFKEIANRPPDSEYAAGQAQQRLSSLLDKLPDDPHVLTLLGDIYAHIGELDKAARYYRGALEQREVLTAAHFGLGAVLLAQQDYAQARPHLQRAVADSPAQVSYLDKLGNVYLLQGEYAQARQYFEQALQLDADFLLLYQEIAVANWWQGEIAAAVRSLERLALRIEDSRVLQRDKNQATWWFPSPRSGLSPHLESWPDKRGYIYESLATGYFLLDAREKSKAYYDKAWAEKSPLRHLLRLLVARDVELALQAKPELAEAVQRWRALVTR